MLTEKVTRLLTAYLDGELTDRHRKTVRRLLRKSADARQLYKLLKSDARGLRSLPSVAAPTDLSASILEEISRLQLPQSAPPAATTGAATGAMPIWANLALAACILAAVTAGSFFYFAGLPSGNENPPIAKENDGEKSKLKLSIAELAKEESHRALLKEFKKTPAVRLDVCTGDPALTVSRLRTILGANDIRTVVETSAKTDLGNRRKGKKYVLFVENVLPYELSTMLQTLGREEEQRPSKVADVALFSLSDKNRSQVAAVLGLAPENLQPPEKTNEDKISRWPGPQLLPKSGEGGNGKKQPKQVASKSRQRMAVILPLGDFDSATSRAATDAVKQFIAARRRAPDPNTLQVMFVLQEAST